MSFPVYPFPARQDSVDPAAWGSAAWLAYFAGGRTFPADEDRGPAAERRRDDYLAELRAMPSTLPCEECGQHAAQELARVDLAQARTYDGYNSLLLHLYNQVRRRQGRAAQGVDELVGWLASKGIQSAPCASCSLGGPVRTATARTTARTTVARDLDRSVDDGWRNAAIGLAATSGVLLLLLLASVRSGRRTREKRA